MLPFTISQSLLKLMSIESVKPSNISFSVVPFSSCLQPFLASGSFPMSLIFTSGGRSIGASGSASIPPMNTQDWFLLWLTGWISLQSKGLARVFFSTTIQKHQFLGVLVVHLVKNLLAMRETWVWSLSWEDPLEKGKATHSSIVAWRIQRVRHDWATFTLCGDSVIWRTF